jgi:hypothetical protein
VRIALVVDYYELYLKSFEAARDTRGLGYREHLDAIVGDYFGSFGSYRNHFRAIGHETELFIGNHAVLQAKWLAEAGSRAPAGAGTKHAVVLDQLRAFAPDAVFVGSMFDYYGAFMREAARIARAVFAWIACPYPGGLDFSGISCMVSSAPTFVEAFRARGLKAERLDAAFDPDILQALGRVDRDIAVSFVGGLSTRTHAFRVSVLESLVRSGIDLGVWGYGLQRRWLGLRPSPLERVFHGAVWGLDYYRILARSRVTLNLHVDVAKQQDLAGNMRAYEATGCGAHLVTDGSVEFSRLFRVGEEVTVFDDAARLPALLASLAGDPGASARIGSAGQSGCIARHGYPVRIREFERILLAHA